MNDDFSNRKLHKASFAGKDLARARFSGSDLRGADFSNANLTGADFSNAKTGITPLNTAFIFAMALVVSALSGFVATLTTRAFRAMMASHDERVEAAAVVTVVIVLFFIVLSVWKGMRFAVRVLILPVVIAAIVGAIVARSTGWGTGRGLLYMAASLVLVMVMFIVGTVARAAAGSLSQIFFVIVALSGGLFSKSLGGGIGTALMAIGCALISKRALAGTPGFENLRKIAFFVTSRFGTSFRDAKLAAANFSHADIRNSDFSGAAMDGVNWNDSRKNNCLVDGRLVVEKQNRKTEASRSLV